MALFEFDLVVFGESSVAIHNESNVTGDRARAADAADDFFDPRHEQTISGESRDPFGHFGVYFGGIVGSSGDRPV